MAELHHVHFSYMTFSFAALVLFGLCVRVCVYNQRHHKKNERNANRKLDKTISFDFDTSRLCEMKSSSCLPSPAWRTLTRYVTNQSEMEKNIVIKEWQSDQMKIYWKNIYMHVSAENMHHIDGPHNNTNRNSDRVRGVCLCSRARARRRLFVSV